MAYSPIARVKGLDDDTLALVNGLLKQLDEKQLRNTLRDTYYDSKRLVRSITDAVPPLYNRLGLVVGWTSKAVDFLVRRCRVEQVLWADGTLDDYGMSEIARKNQLISQALQGLRSSAKHSVAFAIAHADPDSDVPFIHFKDARESTGSYDSRTHRLEAALSVNDVDETGRPIDLTLYEYGKTTVLIKDGASWGVDISTHDYGMPAAALAFSPDLRRPFGRSRITRPMMSIQDQAIRELVRLEGHMDVFSFPELWMLGADMSIFDEEAWRVRMGRLKGVPDDETLENPRVAIQQITASSPDPHLAALNAFAKLFAREASLPDTSLAITDFANPPSAEAHGASQYELIAEAETAQADWRPGLNHVIQTALAMANKGSSVEDFASVDVEFSNPRFLSRSAQADAGLKQIMAVPELATSEVGLELIGLDPRQIERFKAEQRASRSQQMLNGLLGATPPERLEVATDGNAD